MENVAENSVLCPEEQRIALPDKDGFVFIELKRIIRCQSDNSYTDFFILDETSKKKSSIKIVASKGFDHFEKFLISKGSFFRIHNRHIININHIVRYTKNGGGYIIMVDNLEGMVPVARARKDDFLNYLKSKGILL